ncbi:MAG TPA: hypothetical protein VNW29_01590 [Candidatus Sulfotelmatobacter sp.]|jgi:hypothetical protein|nr:hypothetical protein [Candidatus Sulfotelmatobacter sp.]
MLIRVSVLDEAGNNTVCAFNPKAVDRITPIDRLNVEKGSIIFFDRDDLMKQKDGSEKMTKRIIFVRDTVEQILKQQASYVSVSPVSLKSAVKKDVSAKKRGRKKK